jgi:SOS-response transcriptional repressor LexA
MNDRRTIEHRPMTDKQRGVLAFLRSFYEANDQLPPMHVVAAHFGWGSWNSAQTHVEALAKRGLVEKNAVGKWRFTGAAHARIAETVGSDPTPSDER